MYPSKHYLVIISADYGLAMRSPWNLLPDEAQAIRQRLSGVAWPRLQDALSRADEGAISVCHCLHRLLNIMDYNLCIDWLHDEVR